MTEDEWAKVREIRSRCIQAGQVPTQDEASLCVRAMRDDPVRYKQIGVELKATGTDIYPLPI